MLAPVDIGYTDAETGVRDEGIQRSIGEVGVYDKDSEERQYHAESELVEAMVRVRWVDDIVVVWVEERAVLLEDLWRILQS